MPTYEVRDYYSSELLGTVDIDLTGGGSGSADAMTIPAVLLYLIGFIGMAIMLACIPPFLLALGIIAMVVYVAPLLMIGLALLCRPAAEKYKHEHTFLDRDVEPITVVLADLLTGGGGILKNALKHFITPFAYLLFNLFLACFWIIQAGGNANGELLIAFIIPCAYSMYYYPFVLIRNAIRHKSKLLGWLSALIIVCSFGTYLALYDKLIDRGALGIAVLFTSLTVLGSLTVLICNLAYSKKKRRKLRNALLLSLYLLLVLAVLLTTLVFVPGTKKDRYESAMALIAAGDYAAARDTLDDILSYKDSKAQYESILFKELAVGEIIYYGTHGFYGGAYANPGKVENAPVAWIVLEVDAASGKALLLSRDVLDMASFGKESWETTEIRKFLNDGTFEKEILGTEKADKVLTTNVSSLTSNGTAVTEDRFFLLSRAEYDRYVANATLSAMLQDVTYTVRANAWLTHEFEYDEQGWADAVKRDCYYLRDVAEDGEQIQTVQKGGTVSPVDDGGRFFNKCGIRPACFVSIS